MNIKNVQQQFIVADVNLRVRRNLERFQILLGIKAFEAINPIRHFDDGCTMLVEMEEDYISISGHTEVRVYEQERITLRELNKLDPQETEGIPIRIFVVEDKIVLTASIPITTNAEFWYVIYKLIKKRLIAIQGS